MVINPPSESYTQFQSPIIPDDSAQSSEDGSGMHSPGFATGNYPGHTENFRYSQDHLDIQHSNRMITPQYDYGHTLSAQQPPMLDTSLELPNSGARIPFSSHYSIQSRGQMDFHNHQPASSAGVPPMDFRYSTLEERRFTGSPHDQSYTRPTDHSSAISAADHSPSITTEVESAPCSTASASTRSVRKEISSVVIACRQCRARKIRCDSTRPICDNCVRRSHGCEYDEKPRRRGPDKRPGTRQRSCKKRPTDGSVPSPKRQKSMTEQPEPTDVLDSSPDSQTMDHYSPKFYSNLDPATHAHSSAGIPRSTEPNSHSKHELAPTYRRQSSYVYDQDIRHNVVPAARSLEHQQKAWWDTILKSHPLNFIFDELSFIVQNAGNVLFFINLDYVMKRLYSEERLHIQPAFIYAVLALAKLLRSSKLETGPAGLSHALEFVHQAHIAYKDAIDFHWLDATLAGAAFILSLFEISAHPQHSPERIRTSLINLDTLIRNLSLTSIDSHDRASCRFSPGSVPVMPADASRDHFDKNHECACISDPLAARDPYYQHNAHSLPWAPDWSPREIADEEIRRLCWSTLILISDYISQCRAFGEEYPHFYVAEPANYILLFPGEILDRLSRSPGSLSPKESVWALYCRSMLLWNFCHHFPNANTERDLFELASEVVVESQAIENALDTHKCNVDVELVYCCRAYVHNTRMLAAKALSFHDIPPGRTIPGPIFKRKQAQDWLFYGEQIFQRLIAVAHHLTGPDGDQLTRRPYRIAWLMNQLSDCLALWNKDSTLDDALRLGKLIIHILDVTNELWPCPVIQEKCASLRRQLTEACSSKRIEGPIPENLSLPPLLRSLRG